MTPNLPVYLDYSATTPVDPRVFEAMRPYFTEVFGNPSSRSHRYGWDAQDAVAIARNQIAALLGAQAADPDGCRDIIFTSGATEANNLAIKGIAAGHRHKGNHLITQATEHHAVLDTMNRLAEQGFEITFLPVDGRGRVEPKQVARAMKPGTILVSIMWGNNETGTVQPVREIGQVCRTHGVLFHTDATQAVGRLPMNVAADPIDLLSLSAHKLYGPKGCGALYIRRRHPKVNLVPQFDGGGQEAGLRSGTLNVPGIVGLGAACAVAQEAMSVEIPRISQLRNRLEESIRARFPFVTVNGDPERRLPHLTNLSFAQMEGPTLLISLDDLALSSGSACSSHSIEPSFVLRAMGVADAVAQSAIRFSLGRFTTEQEVDYAIERVAAVVARLSAGAD